MTCPRWHRESRPRTCGSRIPAPYCACYTAVSLACGLNINWWQCFWPPEESPLSPKPTLQWKPTGHQRLNQLTYRVHTAQGQLLHLFYSVEESKELHSLWSQESPLRFWLQSGLTSPSLGFLICKTAIIPTHRKWLLWDWSGIRRINKHWPTEI